MARNRNKRKRLAGPVVPTPLAVILSVTVILALGYLWLCGRCDALGRKIKALEQRKIEVHRRVVNEEFKWANMTSPQSMEKLLQAHNLVMTWPAEEAVVRLHRTSSGIAVRHELAQGVGVSMND